jgi:hypothetical protein
MKPFWIGSGVSMRLAGSESAAKLKRVVLASFSGVTASGGVTIEAGAASAPSGTVEASEVSIFDFVSVAMRASRTGQGGVLKLEKSFVSATGDVVMESGSLGDTNVKDNEVYSETRIRVASGPGGACVAEPNEFVAPVVEACP